MRGHGEFSSCVGHPGGGKSRLAAAVTAASGWHDADYARHLDVVTAYGGPRRSAVNVDEPRAPAAAAHAAALAAGTGALLVALEEMDDPAAAGAAARVALAGAHE